MTALPSIPSAAALTTPQQIHEMATQLVQWAEQTDDVAAVKDASAKWAAITEYVRRTSREGVAEAEAALRRLEARAGALIIAQRQAGEMASHGQRHDETSSRLHLTDIGIRRDEAAAFVKMAEHPDVVEEVIARSTDADPPSRRKVIREIDRRKLDGEVAEMVAEQHRRNEAAGYGPAQAAEDNRRNAILMAVSDWHRAGAELHRLARVPHTARLLVATAELRRFAEAEGRTLTGVAA